MTEWERLEKGLVYNDFDEDLFERRVAAKNFLKRTIKRMTKTLSFVIKFYSNC